MLINEDQLIRSDRHPNGMFERRYPVLNEITLGWLVDKLHETQHNITDQDIVTQVAEQELGRHITDMWHILDENMDEIIAMANAKDSIPTFDPIWVIEAKILAKGICAWAESHRLEKFMTIYANGDEAYYLEVGSSPIVVTGSDPNDYIWPVRNPNILSMSFGDELYKVLNHYSTDAHAEEYRQEFNDLFRKQGFTYRTKSGDFNSLTVYLISEGERSNK